MTEPAETVRRVTEALDRPLPYRTEAELQDAIIVHLAAEGLPVLREVILGTAGRIDFTVGRVGVEVKIKGSAAEVGHQLARYADTGMLDWMLLVTTNPRHLRLGIRTGRRLQLPLTVMRLPWM